MCIVPIYLLLNSTQQVITYDFGGWSSLIGIQFKLTQLSLAVASLISFIALLTHLSCKQEAGDVNTFSAVLFSAVLLILIAGLCGIVFTNDFFNLYVFIEIASLTTYALVAIGGDKAAVKAAFNYLIVGTIAATFILIGIGYIYAASGTLNMDDFVDRFDTFKDARATRVGIVLMLGGLMVKAGLFPLHNWMVYVYKTTNSFFLTFTGSVSAKVYALVIIKLIYFVFTPDLVLHIIGLKKVILLCGLLAISIGAITAFYQEDLRSFLAFSSVSQIGYTFIAIAIGAFSSAVILMAAHVLTASACFMICAYIHAYKGTYELKKLYKLFEEMPYISLLFIINIASLVGIPLTAGFISKVSLVLTALDQKAWIVVGLIVLSTFMTLLYGYKISRTLLFSSNNGRTLRSMSGPDICALSVVTVITLINISIGLMFNHVDIIASKIF
jgi:multicomponent Na+:H+ antiporter subunit D